MVWLVAPVYARFGSMLVASTPFPHDAVLNAGVLEWVYRALIDPSISVFNWTAGFPLANTLAGTENLIGWQLLYAPLRAMGATVAAGYNTILIASLAIGGLGAVLLARTLGSSRAGACLAGFLFAFNPFHLDHAIQIQTMAICWSPFALVGMELTLRRQGRWGPMILTTAMVMSVYCGMYFAVFLPIVLSLYATLSWLTKRYDFEWTVLRELALAAGVSTVILLPVLLPYLKFAAANGAYPHPAEMLSKFSLPLAALARIPRWVAVWQGTPLATESTSFAAFPGLVTVSLAAFALLRVRDDEKSRRVVWLLLGLAATCLILALGPYLTLHTSVVFEPLRWLPLPGRIWLAITAVRWPIRIFLYAVLAGSILAGLGLTRLEGIAGKSRRAVAVACLAVAWLELRPATWYAQYSHRIAEPIAMSDSYPFLATEPDTGAVAELPARTPAGYPTPFMVRYTYGSAGHMRRVVAFHGSFLPPLMHTLRAATFQLPDSSALEILASHGVTRLVIHKELFSDERGTALVSVLSGRGYPLLFESPKSVVFATRIAR